jgi:Flp pilus assembly protein TadG
MSNAIQRTATGKTPVTRLMRRLQARAQRLLDDTAGVAALEFALLSPVMLAMLLGMFSFGVAMKDYMVLTSAAGQGALNLALSRGTVGPFSTTRDAILAAAPTLTPASLSMTLTIGTTDCTSDATCLAAMGPGKSAIVTATYPCTLSVMGINYKPDGCTLRTSTAQMIQ